MAATKQLISTVTVGSGGAAAIEFSSIPQGFTDLQIVLSTRSTNATNSAEMTLKFNTSALNLTARWMYGNPPGGNAASGTNSYYVGVTSAASDTSNTFGNISIYIPNYAGSTNKSFSTDSVSENNASAAFPFLVAGLWSNTAAITAISLLGATGNLAQYSTASLYGITSGNGGATVS